jgi:hypothetical protein
MEHSGESVGVYAEAKGEYTRQLCQFLGPAFQRFFITLLDTAKEREPEPKKLLLSFQTLLEGISEWNIDKVQRETQNISMSSQCDYLEELLTAVFVAHTKVLSSVRLTNKQRKLQITIPKLEHFLHKTLIECARLLWMNAFLFTPTGSSIDRQKNMKQIEALIMDGILQGVRVMLPVKSILREYLSTDDTDTEAEETDNEDDDEDEEEDEEEEEEEEEVPEKVEEPPPPVIPSRSATPERPATPQRSATPERPATPQRSATPERPATPQRSPTPERPRTPVVDYVPPPVQFEPTNYDSYSSAPPQQNNSRPSTPKPPVETPTIYLDEPNHVKFSNVDSVFSHSNIEDTKLSENKNEIISEEVDTDMFEFEEL